MSRLNWNKPKKQVDEFCAVRILPYVIEKDGGISILFGLDRKYKEWSPFGGSCGPQKGSCSRKETSELNSCLAREISEESKEIIDLNKTVDFVNCRYVHYVMKKSWANLHNNIYFAQWEGSDKETIIKHFNDKSRDDKLTKKLLEEKKEVKSYFEMESIEFIPINYDVFGEYIYNTIQDFYQKEATYKKDKVFHNQISDTFSALFRAYPESDKKKNTDGKRLDPNFLLGFIDAIADYFANEFKYKHIDDIVDDIIRYIKSMKKGCSLDSSKIEFPTYDSGDDTPLK